jgi:arylsulfatase A-like enzyme
MTLPNVLLVVLDSVRAANTSLHGYENETTPFLREFADRTTVYTQARTPGVHSIASHVSLFTGYHVAEHRASDHEAVIDTDRTIWKAIGSAHGYETGLFTPNVVVTSASNLADAFDTVEGPRRRTTPFRSALAPGDLPGQTGYVEYLKHCLADDQPAFALANGIADRLSAHSSRSSEAERADVYVDSFLDWRDQRSGPWAACLNLMDAHYPYVPAEEYDRWGGPALRRLYATLPPGPQPREFLSGRPWWQSYGRSKRCTTAVSGSWTRRSND